MRAFPDISRISRAIIKIPVGTDMSIYIWGYSSFHSRPEEVLNETKDTCVNNTTVGWET